MSEYEHHVAQFRKVLDHECNEKGVKLFRMSRMNIVQELLGCALDWMKPCLDDPTTRGQIRRIVKDYEVKFEREVAERE